MLSPPVLRYDQWKFSTQMLNHNVQLFAMVIVLRASSRRNILRLLLPSGPTLVAIAPLQLLCAVALASEKQVASEKASAIATTFAIAVAANSYELWQC